MVTYSIYPGTPIESTSYPVNLYLDDLLYGLKDNKEKFITPANIRNSVLSTWDSSAFKEIVSGNYSYIAINEDELNRKILIGKRAFSATHSYKSSDDIMTSLMSSDADIFFYNTKLDTISNTKTKISILSGSSHTLYKRAPYIQSEKVSGITQSLSLDIFSYGNLSFNSSSFYLNKGTAGALYFPTGASAGNNKLFFYKDNELSWDELKMPEVDSIGITGSELNVYGKPVNVNGYSLELNDDRYMGTSVGSINMGSSFDDSSIESILRGLIYTYSEPTATISIDISYAEVGTYTYPIISYSITKKSLNTITTGLTNMIPGTYPPIINDNQITVNGTASAIIVLPIKPRQTHFKVTVSDGTGSDIATTYITGIYPYFYGFSNLPNMNNSELSGLSKVIEYKSDKLIDISGKGYYYFIYDKDYGDLLEIYDDDNGNSPTGLTSSIKTFSSPDGLWSTKEFKVYQWSVANQIGPPSVNYKFKY
jgi:hypothetical protein